MSSGLTPSQRRGLDRLAEQGILSPEQAAAVRSELDGDRETHHPLGSGLWEVLGYVGGALILGGAGLLLQMSWDDLSRGARVGLLAGAAVVLAAAGVLIAGGPRGLRVLAGASPSRRSRIVGVLFALCSGTAAMAVGSALDQFAEVAATLVGLVVALLGYLVLLSTPGLLAAGAFSVGVVLAGAQEWFDSSTPSVSAGLLLVGVVWAALAAARMFPQRDVGLGGGTAIALAGAQWPLGSDAPAWGYITTFVLAVVCFAAYVLQRVLVLLVLGVIGVTLAVPEAVWDWTDGALGGPLIVLLVGVVLLATGGLGLRLRKMTSNPESGAAEPGEA